MATISVENFLHTDRPLTWRPKPTCDRCLLPFTNESDDLVRRIPFLLVCQHLMCGQCVQEYASNGALVCELCKKSTPLGKEQNDATVALHPSYYMLGVIERTQEELQNIQQYWEGAGAQVEVDRYDQSFAAAVSLSEINTPRKLRSILGKACHAYEKSTLKLHERNKTLTENVDQIVRKVNAHFLSMHNALQLEEHRILRQVRKSFLKHRQLKAELQQRLETSEIRLKELTIQAKRFPDGGSMGSLHPSWEKLVTEVKQFLEKEPLKLVIGMDGIRSPVTFQYTEHEAFLHTLTRSYSLILPDAGKTMQLVPVAHHGGLKKHATPHATVVPTVDRSNTTVSAQNRTTSIVRDDCGMPQSKLLEQSISRNVSEKTGGRKRNNSYLSHRTGREQRQRLLSFSMVKVTCIVNPHEFYVQDQQFIKSTAKSVEEQCQAEADSYDSEKRLLTIARGSMYLARPDGSDRWYRAMLLRPISKPCSEKPVQFMVQYVDYGRMEAIVYDQIRPISKKLSEIRYGAVKCALYNVVPPKETFDGGINEESNASCWPKECVQVMNDFMAGQNMVMCKLSNRNMPPSSSDCWLVDLFLPPTLPEPVQASPNAFISDEFKWEGYYAPMSLSSMLCYLQQCHLADKHQQRVDANTVEYLNHWVECATQRSLRLYNIPPSPVLREFDSFDARITHVTSPDHFYIMPEQWKVNKFDLLQEQLVTMCREKQSEKFFCPYVGLICAFTIDYDVQEDYRVWLRGRVQKVLIGACEMFTLDTGETLVAYWEDMRLLAPGSAPLAKHSLAINCRLDHIHPKRPVDYTGVGQPSWSGEALAEFRHITCCTTFRFTVQIGQLCLEFDIYNVVLYLRNKADRETCVNGMLVASGFAVCDTDKEDEISDRSRVAFGNNEPTAGGMVTSTTTEAVVKRVIDPRVPVNVLKVVSPSEIYVQMCSRATGLEKLHETIQQHMNNEMEKLSGGLEKEYHQWSIGDMCVALVSSVEDDASAGAWYRARISASCEQNTEYEVFLIDRAVTVKVSRTMIARLTALIAQVQPGAIRCRLACIEPVGGNADWHQSTLDGFKSMIKSFRMHAITLDSKAQRDVQSQSLSVVLWGVRQSVPQPLAPRSTEYRNLNQLLVVRGLAHSSGRFRTFATKGSGAEQELETLEQAIEEMQRAECEKMQQFLQDVIGDAEQASVERGQEGLWTVVNDRDTHAVMMDKTCAAALALADVSVEHIDAWPKSQPIEKTVFVGMPTSIGNDGTIFLYDICQEPVLHRIRDMIETYVTRMPAKSSAKGTVFKPNDPCLARYHLDGHYYRGTVLNPVGSGKYRVLFVDYGNEEICSGEHDLLSDVVCVRVPVQISRFRLAGVKPKRLGLTTTNGWPEEILDACHGLLVQKCCMIRVESSARNVLRTTEQDDTCIPCRITLLKDSVDVGSVLINMGLVESSVEGKEARRNWKEREEFSYSFSKPAIGYQDPLNRDAELSVEHRDLMRFIGQIAENKQNMQLKQESDFEDPNEIPETTVDDCDWMNPQPLDKDVVACDNDDDDGGGHEKVHRVTNDLKYNLNVTNRSLPSPVYFDWDGLRYDTSSRLSDEDDPNDDEVKCCRTAGLEDLSNGFVVQPTIYSSHGFFAEFTTVYDDGQTLHVFPHLEGHTQRIARMAEKIQQAARLRPDPQQWNPRNLKPGAPCLAPYRADGLYYRAIVEEVIEEPCQMRVLYVDYLNRDTLPVSELRRCPSGMRYIPLRNIKVRLVGVRPNPRLRVTDVICRLEEQLQRPFYVKIVRLPEQSVSESLMGDTVAEVELYTDFDCITLAYQKMIDEKYYFGGSSS